MGLFDLQPTVTLYDLTNTYFEGEAGAQPQAKRGHSKEKRSDCPLLTLGLMLDASGSCAARRSSPGVREHRTLAGMLEVDAPAGALVVMDRGVATEAAIGWRATTATAIWSSAVNATGSSTPRPPWRSARSRVHLHKVVSTDPGEVRLYCYSEERAHRSGPSLSGPPPASRPR